MCDLNLSHYDTFDVRSIPSGRVCMVPLTSEVGHLVEHVWQEALGHLSSILTAPVETISVDKVYRMHVHSKIPIPSVTY